MSSSPHAVRDLRRDRLAALAQQRRGRRGQRRQVRAARAVEPLAGQQPRQLLAVGHRRIRHEPHARHAHGAVHLDARFDGEVLAQRDDVERRIVDGPVEDEAAAVDVEPLAEHEIGARDGADRAVARASVPAARRRHAHLAREARLEPLAAEAEVAPQRDLEVERQRQVAARAARVPARLPDDDDVVRQRAHARWPRTRRALRRCRCSPASASLPLDQRQRALAVGDEQQVRPVDDGEVLRLPFDAAAGAIAGGVRRARHRSLRGEAAVAAPRTRSRRARAMRSASRARSVPSRRCTPYCGKVEAQRVARQRAGDGRLRERAAARRRRRARGRPSPPRCRATAAAAAATPGRAASVRGQRRVGRRCWPGTRARRRASRSRRPCRRAPSGSGAMAVERVVVEARGHVEHGDAERQVGGIERRAFGRVPVAAFAPDADGAVEPRRGGERPVAADHQRRRKRQRRAGEPRERRDRNAGERTLRAMRPSSIAR